MLGCKGLNSPSLYYFGKRLTHSVSPSLALNMMTGLLWKNLLIIHEDDSKNQKKEGFSYATVFQSLDLIIDALVLTIGSHEREKYQK